MSRVSPHLHFGELALRQVWAAVGAAVRSRPALAMPVISPARHGLSNRVIETRCSPARRVPSRGSTSTRRWSKTVRANTYRQYASRSQSPTGMLHCDALQSHRWALQHLRSGILLKFSGLTRAAIHKGANVPEPTAEPAFRLRGFVAKV